MSKIICDICGTTYQESAECCPICGCSRDSAADLLGEEILTEEIVEESGEKGGSIAQKKKKEIFDFDEVNAEENEDDEDDEDEEDDYDDEEDDEEDEDAPRHNTFVVILLTILIAGLLLAAGFIFFRYFLPNMGDDKAVATTAPVQVVETTEAETTEATIPCEMMTMTNVGTAELNEIGQQFLLHIKVQPEDTTDKIIYTSGDESIATVTEDGKITAIAEGETIIYISCGGHSLECPVIVKYVEETVPPTTEETVPETFGETDPEATEETVPEETEDAGLKTNVTLKLKKTDISLGVYLKYQLLLDCDLEQNEVEWSSEHPHIATVDENGTVTAVKRGTTIVTAKYGSQEATCWIRIS